VVIVTFTTPKQTHDHHAHRHGHEHEVGLRETFDFLNTLEFEEGSPVDKQLTSPAMAIRWLADHGLLHDETADRLLVHHERSEDRAERDLARFRGARAALREVAVAVIGQRTAQAAAIREVNRVLRSRPTPRLDSAPNGVDVCHDHEADPLDDAFAQLAEPLVREIATGRPERLRVCANDECGEVFFDTSPTGRRRWCEMASCGNRAKAARHRARVRQVARTSGAARARSTAASR
jgi:predicted RNA-binding Zn ribbon-like protein